MSFRKWAGILLSLFVFFEVSGFGESPSAEEKLDWSDLSLDGIRLDQNYEEVLSRIRASNQLFEELSVSGEPNRKAIRVTREPSLYVRFEDEQVVQIAGAETLTDGPKVLVSVRDDPSKILEIFGEPLRSEESNCVLYEYRGGGLAVRFSLTFNEDEILRIGMLKDGAMISGANPALVARGSPH